jgi:hypothetical protein
MMEGKPLSRRCLEKGRMKSHVDEEGAFLMNGGLKEWKESGEGFFSENVF